MRRSTDAEVRRTYLHGPEGVRQAGHREYVGGLWDEVGPLQLRFLRGRGLGRDHRLLDIGCGALRGGVHLVRYLDAEQYTGVDKEPELLRIGAEQELGAALMAAKRPTLLALADFEFDRLPARPDTAWAHSLSPHLPMGHIRRCLPNPRPVIAPRGLLYATYGECDEPKDNPPEPHDHRLFEYTRAEMVEAGLATGWRVEHLGKWGHPRGHRMVRCTPSPASHRPRSRSIRNTNEGVLGGVVLLDVPTGPSDSNGVEGTALVVGEIPRDDRPDVAGLAVEGDAHADTHIRHRPLGLAQHGLDGVHEPLGMMFRLDVPQQLAPPVEGEFLIRPQGRVRPLVEVQPPTGTPAGLGHAAAPLAVGRARDRVVQFGQRHGFDLHPGSGPGHHHHRTAPRRAS